MKARRSPWRWLLPSLMATAFSGLCADREHADPPPGDPCLTNRLGVSWGEPIYSGFLFIRGKYIDAPYVVEQRGYKIFVNGVQAARLQPRAVLPLPTPQPVTEDPGMPRDLVRDSSLGETLMHPVVTAKRHYWEHIGLYGQDRVQAEIKYLSSLPSVARVVDTKQQGVGNTRTLEVWDHEGNSIGTMVPLEQPPTRVQSSDREIYGWIQGRREEIERELRDGLFVMCGTGGIVSSGGYPDRQRAEFARLFEAYAAEAPAEERLKNLKAIGFIPEHRTLEMADRMHYVSSFQATDQLWQRLRGDPSWKKDVEDRLFALTNGWRRIPPEFMKEESIPSCLTPKVSVTAIHPPNDDANTTTGPDPSPEEEVPAQAKPSSASCNGHCSLLPVLMGSVLLALAGAAVLLLVRRK